MSLADLEAAVSQLPPAELTTFAKWFQGYLGDASDAPPDWHIEE